MGDVTEVKVIRVRKDSRMPEYKTEQAAGADVYANNTEPIVLAPGERCLVPLGLVLEIPVGFEVQLRPRSGLALNHGITLLNSPGTLDADYRDEIGAIIINHGTDEFTIKPGMRIAQMVLARCEKASFTETDSVSTTERGKNGFGHTGLN